jgi:TatD DNase family protein
LEYHLPLVLHCREAFPELFEVMEPYKKTELNGIFHSFTGTLEEAGQVLEYARFFFGINGVVTFKKSSLAEVLPHIPLGRIVLETDSPYLAPVPFRGKRNESSYIKNVAMKLAEIYGLDFKDVDRITANNALKVFKMAE